MKIIDLSLEMYDKMPVFPGDPEVRIETIEQVIEGNDWFMKGITMSSHDGTHVNIPAHTKRDGKTLDEYPLERFCGDAVLYENKEDLQKGIGVIFDSKHEFTKELAHIAINREVSFIGVTNDFDLDVERYTLDHDLISFERLVNTDKLPKRFTFFGMPLKIKEGDGSPVRAFAVVK